jgi:hypothetical protein
MRDLRVRFRAVLLRCLHALALILATGPAHACLFVTSTPAAQWYNWASGLFAGTVVELSRDPRQSVDVVTVRVAETLKGVDAAFATVHVPSRVWAACRLEKPLVGAQVLVAINPNEDAFVIPLSERDAERLRTHRRRARRAAGYPGAVPPGGCARRRGHRDSRWRRCDSATARSSARLAESTAARITPACLSHSPLGGVRLPLRQM